MIYKLTRNSQYSKHDKDGKDRNHLTYYINGIEILKQKIPFNTNWEHGFDRRTVISNEYLLNGKLYQTRYFQTGTPDKPKKIRNVSYPISKKILSELGIPNDLKIEYVENDFYEESEDIFSKHKDSSFFQKNIDIDSIE
jgi:hypothetical protein